MRRWLILVTILILLLSATAIALAQDATPTPPQGTVVPMPPVATDAPGDDDDDNEQPPSQQTPAATPEGNVALPASTPAADAATGATAATTSQAFMRIDLTAGFALDPFFVSLNGGGTRDAMELAPECAGWVSENPVVSLNWQGTAEFAEVFVYSDHNPLLIVETPAGDFLCSTDTNRLVQDPSLEVANPPAGTYNIWVGNEDNVGLIPAVLVLTTREDVNIGTFDLTGLVKRPALRETLVEAHDAILEAVDVQARLRAPQTRAFAPNTIEAGDTLTFTTVISGGVPGFIFPTADASPNRVCSGVINPDSLLSFAAGADVDALNVFLETELDGTLLIVQPDGSALCTDDSEDGSNLNPQILLTDLQEGTYRVAVGSVQSGMTSEGIITISTDMEITPALASPESTGDSE